MVVAGFWHDHHGAPWWVAKAYSLLFFGLWQKAPRAVPAGDGLSAAEAKWLSESRLELGAVPGGERLRVADDGRGFDVHRVAEDPRKVGSYGLVGMRERAELMGGTLEIVSQSLEGTVVTLIGPSERAE